MSMFPGACATVYHNEAGEVLGWDYDPGGPPDIDDFYDDYNHGWSDDHEGE